MSAPQEFLYRLPGRAGGWRPGSHRARSLGPGQEFISHARLFDRPDPRRLDLRASLRSLDGEWLVRAHRQRAAIAVQAVVDVSASMAFGAPRTKRDVAADFVEALGTSAFRVGDAAGMLAFDRTERHDLFVAPLSGRGAGVAMATRLRAAACEAAGAIDGLEQALDRLAGRRALIFLVSDFHFPLARLGAVLGPLANACVVPVVLWDPAETEPPAADRLAALHDLESHRTRTLLVRAGLRGRWRAAVEGRRTELRRIFADHGIRPHFVLGGFDAEALSRYFLEMPG
jgi:hypothetical protein